MPIFVAACGTAHNYIIALLTDSNSSCFAGELLSSVITKS